MAVNTEKNSVQPQPSTEGPFKLTNPDRFLRARTALVVDIPSNIKLPNLLSSAVPTSTNALELPGAKVAAELTVDHVQKGLKGLHERMDLASAVLEVNQGRLEADRQMLSKLFETGEGRAQYVTGLERAISAQEKLISIQEGNFALLASALETGSQHLEKAQGHFAQAEKRRIDGEPIVADQLDRRARVTLAKAFVLAQTPSTVEIKDEA